MYKGNTLLLVNVVDLFGNEEEEKKKVRGRKYREKREEHWKGTSKGKKDKGKQSRENLKKRKINGLWHFWKSRIWAELNLCGLFPKHP